MRVNVEPGAVKRIEELRQQRGNSALKLRITVDGGGCSGFQYKMELTESINTDDEVFDNAVITDEISLPYLNGATVRYDQALIGAEFVIDNPNAKTGCGCGASFSV